MNVVLFVMDVPPTPDVAYDLRQAYAKLVGEHLLDIAYSRKQKNLPDYFGNLEDLYVIVQHKIREKIDKKKKEQKEEKSYEDLKKEFIQLSNKTPDAYLNLQSQDGKAIGEIFYSLKKIEMYLYKKMDDAHMFGSKRSMEGLI